MATPILAPLENTIATSYFYILKLETDKVLPEYISWYLNQPPSQSYIQSHARGTGMLLIPKKDFIELAIDIPPMETQKIIVKLNQLQQKESCLLKELETK